jgi:sulfoxide reductase heme-binding subunit YedZ
MTNAYSLVQWNKHKRIYDSIIGCAIFVYLMSFITLGVVLYPAPNNISFPILIIRAFGTCAIILLHFILCIGPVARISSMASPILYNRRHLGVVFFFIALVHGLAVFGYYGGFGVVNPISAVLTGSYRSGGIPFEFFGFLALLIVFVMAATSHDFWLANLGAAFWKSLHMSVYAAYMLIVLHVVYGALQSETNIIYSYLIGAGVLIVVSLHLVAGVRELREDGRGVQTHSDDWIDVCGIDEINDNRAKVVQVEKRERIAIYKYDGKLSAVSNTCVHQGGPLGEGKILDGCITCPWHGYQYLPGSGQSPPPYTEKIETYELRIDGMRVLLNPHPNAPGTPVEPVDIRGEPNNE